MATYCLSGNYVVKNQVKGDQVPVLKYQSAWERGRKVIAGNIFFWYVHYCWTQMFLRGRRRHELTFPHNS